ncbi:hypothetical protein [Psychrobacter sp. 16-MNA-CIBAN-0192]|uniref:hypothetical protein n=1 Tax=Psychrobacter sp. 16-MNA-CIBAN-0192 TaxID=3140448 RepID=UPI003323C0FF
MTSSNPYNFVPLQPTGRNETNTSNTYTPDDMIKIYEQQFLTEVPEDKITEFLPALKEFYGIDGHTLDIGAVIFDAIADFCIIYNHKVKVGGYEILGGLVKEEVEQEEGSEAQAYSLDCKRTFFINDVELPYHFNLFIHGDSYSVLPEKESILEKLYWFVSDRFEETEANNEADNGQLTARLQFINEQLAGLGIRSMDVTTINEIVEYIDDSIIDDDMIDALNILLDNAE